MLCDLTRKQLDQVPFVVHQIGSVVLEALFGKEKAKDPFYIADQLGFDILSFTFVPPLFFEEMVLPDGCVH